MKAKKMLLIVDPQIDFITGSLPVPQAQAAMDELGKYIFDNDGNYCCKLLQQIGTRTLIVHSNLKAVNGQSIV